MARLRGRCRLSANEGTGVQFYSRLSAAVVLSLGAIAFDRDPARADGGGVKPVPSLSCPKGPPAHASGRAVDPAVVCRLLRWIGDNTSYDVTQELADPPEIGFSETGATIRYGGEELIVEPHLRALYEAEQRRIILALPWSISDARDMSRLLHELIHDVQFQSRTWPCPQATEWEAYHLQDRWLHENGVSSHFNWLEIRIWSRCDTRVRP